MLPIYEYFWILVEIQRIFFSLSPTFCTFFYKLIFSIIPSRFPTYSAWLIYILYTCCRRYQKWNPYSRCRPNSICPTKSKMISTSRITNRDYWQRREPWVIFFLSLNIFIFRWNVYLQTGLRGIALQEKSVAPEKKIFPRPPWTDEREWSILLPGQLILLPPAKYFALSTASTTNPLAFEKKNRCLSKDLRRMELLGLINC